MDVAVAEAIKSFEETVPIQSALLITVPAVQDLRQLQRAIAKGLATSKKFRIRSGAIIAWDKNSVESLAIDISAAMATVNASKKKTMPSIHVIGFLLGVDQTAAQPKPVVERALTTAHSSFFTKNHGVHIHDDPSYLIFFDCFERDINRLCHVVTKLSGSSSANVPLIFISTGGSEARISCLYDPLLLPLLKEVSGLVSVRTHRERLAYALKLSSRSLELKTLLYTTYTGSGTAKLLEDILSCNFDKTMKYSIPVDTIMTTIYESMCKESPVTHIIIPPHSEFRSTIMDRLENIAPPESVLFLSNGVHVLANVHGYELAEKTRVFRGGKYHLFEAGTPIVFKSMQEPRVIAEIAGESFDFLPKEITYRYARFHVFANLKGTKFPAQDQIIVYSNGKLYKQELEFVLSSIDTPQQFRISQNILFAYKTTT